MGCTQEPVPAPIATTPSVSSKEFIEATQPIAELIKNPDDPQDEKINEALFGVVQAFEEISKNPKLMKWVLEEIKAQNGEMNLVDLAAKNRHFSLTLEKGLEKVYQKNNLSKSGDSFLESTHKSMKYGKVNYGPNAYIPNAEIADFNQEPVISVGTDIENITGLDDLDELADYDDDYIPGRIYHTNGTYQEVIVGEQTAMTTTQPIVVISPSNQDLTPVPVDAPQKANTNPLVTGYQINFPYDKSRRSEYRIVSIPLYFGGGHGANSSNGIGYNISKVHKNDIGKIFNNVNFTIPVNNINIAAGAWIVTFEYDWWASKKYITVNGGPFSRTLACKMKYSDNWYQVMYTTVGTTQTSTSKGFITIRWVN
ncbi:MAG: hypothetical protein NW226_14995 [Microscillaceae bacterium]|nr:hypothetical protein [Microscillaceae bacterium]